MTSLTKWLRVMPAILGIALLGAGCGDPAANDTTVSTPDATVTTDDAGDVSIDVEDPAAATTDTAVEVETP